MAQRIVRRAPRIIPSNPELQTSEMREPAGQDPSSEQDQEGLASIVFLAGVGTSNTAVARYVNSFNNSNYAATVQGAAK